MWLKKGEKIYMLDEHMQFHQIIKVGFFSIIFLSEHTKIESLNIIFNFKI